MPPPFLRPSYALPWRLINEQKTPDVVRLIDAHSFCWMFASNSADELKLLLRPYDADLMEAYAVSRVVNSVKNDTEECIEPVED